MMKTWALRKYLYKCLLNVQLLASGGVDEEERKKKTTEK